MSIGLINILAAMLVLATGAFLAGGVMGYNYGTKDTERRWSDAVARAADRKEP